MRHYTKLDKIYKQESDTDTKEKNIWSNDFQKYQQAKSAIKEVFVYHNQKRIHAPLGYLTPFEVMSRWKRQHEKEKKTINKYR